MKSRESIEIADELRQQCESIPNVVVLAMGGDAAIAGIRDQILSVGAGKGLPGARTGASDSSWVRDALAKANNDPRRILFTSKNAKDILATTRELGHEDAIVQIWGRGDDGGMFEKYFPPLPPPTPSSVGALSALRIITATLQQNFHDAIAADDRHGPPPEWIAIPDVAIGNVIDAGDRRDIEDLIDPYAEMEPSATLIDVRDVEVEGDKPDVTVSYTVRLLADVRVEGRAFDNDGNTVHDWLMLRDRVLVVPFVAQLSDDTIHDVRQDDTADSFPGGQRFDDSYDAASWLYNEEVAKWDHITIEPDPGVVDTAGAPHRFVLRGPYGRTETAELVVDQYEFEWTLEFEHTGVSISAYYDHGSQGRLDKESYTMYPPVDLRSKVPGRQRYTPEPYTALAEVWAFLMADQPPDGQ